MDEQIIVDIQVDSDSFVEAEKRVDQLTDSIEELTNRISGARKQNKDYKKQQEELNKEYEKGAIKLDDYEKNIDDLNKKINVNNKIIAESTIEKSKESKARAANIRLLKSESGALAELEAKASLLNQAITNQTTATEEGRKEYARLEKELGAVNEQINEQRQAFNDNTKNIGNYTQSIVKAVDILKKQEKEQKKELLALMQKKKAIDITTEDQEKLNVEILNTQTALQTTNKELKKYGENLNITDSEIINVTKDTTKMTLGMRLINGAGNVAGKGIRVLGNAFKTIMKIGILGLISAIVGGLSLLFNAFKKSENGSKALSKIMAGLEGLFSILITVMNKFAGFLLKAFEDPQKAVKDLWEAIKTNIVNRFGAIIELFGAIGQAISGDFSKAVDTGKKALAKLATGLDETQMDGIIDEFKDAAKEAENLAAKYIKLEAAQRAMRSQSRGLEKEISVLNAEFERLSEVAGDDTLNMEEMKQAAEDAGEVAIKLAIKQEQLAKVRLATISQEVNLRKSSGEDIQDLLDQQADAEIALTEARSNSAMQQQKILIEQKKIERDIFEQNLDILLDVGDKIKTEQEKQITNESLSIEKRKSLLAASKTALTANFAAISKEYELYGITAEQINDVINTSDAKQANEKLKALGLNEIANNRLREIILERKQAELDFADLQKDLDKEETERKTKAVSDIRDFEQQKNQFILESQIKELEGIEEKAGQKRALELKLRDDLIKFEEEKLSVLLEGENLSAEERKALTIQSELEILKIKDQFADEGEAKQAERDAANIERVQSNLDAILSITQEFAGAEAAIFGTLANSIVNVFKDGEISATETIEALGMVSQAVFSAVGERQAEEMSKLEAQKQSELELAEDNEEAKLAIEEKYDAENKKLKLKQFNTEKAAALLQIGIQTSLAVMKSVAASPLTGGLPFSAIVGGIGLVQAGIVAAKKPPTFGDGVGDIVNIGGSHAGGNDTTVVGFSGGKSQILGKVEKGERMPVIKASSANDALVSQLNSKGRIFANGTNDILSNSNTTNNNGLTAEQVKDIVRNMPPIYTKVEDVTKEMSRKAQIVDNGKV